MNGKRFLLSTAALLVTLALALALVSPALAFESRAGDTVTVAADEVVEDDLYLTGGQITVAGTIRGDLVAAGSDITISGVVEGDVIAGGRQVIISGEVGDDVRAAGMVIEVQGQAVIGGDLLATGFSLVTSSGSVVQGDVVYGGYQADLDGEIGGSALVGSNSLRLGGTINNSLSASVGAPEDRMPFNPFPFMPNMPDIELIPGGFTLGPQAVVLGNLEIEANNVEALDIPEGQVEGSIERVEPEVQQPAEEPDIVRQPPNPALTWFFDLLRSVIALVVVGLLFLWLARGFLTGLVDTLQARPWASLGWGFLTLLLVPILAIVLVMVFTLLAIFLYALTLGNLGGALIWLGILLVLGLLVLFWLAIAFLAKLVVGYLLGRLVLGLFNARAAASPVWAFLLGILLLALLLSIPYLGWIFNLLTTMFGLGALVVLLYNRTQGEQPTASLQG